MGNILVNAENTNLWAAKQANIEIGALANIQTFDN